MRLFFLSVTDYESYSPTLLTSKRDMSENEFTKLVDKIKTEQWTQIVQNPKIDCAYGSDLASKILKVLVRKHGFRVMDIAEYTIFDGDYQKHIEKGRRAIIRTEGKDMVDVAEDSP